MSKRTLTTLLSAIALSATAALSVPTATLVAGIKSAPSSFQFGAAAPCGRRTNPIARSHP